MVGRGDERSGKSAGSGYYSCTGMVFLRNDGSVVGKQTTMVVQRDFDVSQAGGHRAGPASGEERTEEG